MGQDKNDPELAALARLVELKIQEQEELGAIATARSARGGNVDEVLDSLDLERAAADGYIRALAKRRAEVV